MEEPCCKCKGPVELPGEYYLPMKDGEVCKTDDWAGMLCCKECYDNYTPK
jgi:hypothetical protein